jgi:predicted dehydrogenase
LHSSLVAVMRRDAARAKEYADRNGIGKWYDDGAALINDESVQAIYIATPPSTHEVYTLQALSAGKPVYVEKPMSTDAASAARMLAASTMHNTSLVVAHYRRAQPMYMRLKELLKDGIIGKPLFVDLKFVQPLLSPEDLTVPKTAWRVNPAISGGGLFHDMAPHQLDLMLYFFGKIAKANGVSANKGQRYLADDIVCGSILFENDIVFNGKWSFCNNTPEATDEVVITGTGGIIKFAVFGEPVIYITTNGKTESLQFKILEHVQQPMIQKVVDYFLGKADNPCPAEDGVEVMQIIDAFTGKD